MIFRYFSRERRLCFCVVGVMACSVLVGVLVAVALFVTFEEGKFICCTKCNFIKFWSGM